MKKYICLAMSALLFAACYDDKGNYDYRFDEMNDINLENIVFSPKSYESLAGTMIEIQQPQHNDTVVRVNVQLEQTLATNYDNLDFMWVRQYEDKDALNNPIDRCDTIYTVGYIDLPFKAREHREYNLSMIITDRTTTLKYYKNIEVKTRPIYKNSLFVLHGEEGNRRMGNVELIGDIPNVVIDAYTYVHPTVSDKPFANAEQLDFSTCLDQKSTNESSRTLCVFRNDGTALVWEPYALSQKLSNMGTANVFNTKWGALLPVSITGLGDVGGMANAKLIINYDGRYFVAGTFFSYIPYDNKLSPIPPNHQTDFFISAGTIMKDFYILWDSKHERFLYQSRQPNIDNQSAEDKARSSANKTIMGPLCDAFVDFSALEAQGLSPKGKRAVYCYISSKEDYQQAHPFFIFVDDTTEEYYLYELTASPTLVDPNKSVHKLWGKVKGAALSVQEEPMFTIEARKLPSLRPGKFATNICYSLSYSTNYIFFIDETAKAVYRYNTQNDELYTVYEAPVGYDITKIKFRTGYFFQETNVIDFSFQRTLPHYLSIALYNGENGAVTEVKLDNTGDLDTSFPVVLYEGTKEEKFGKIKDMQFVYGYYND